MFPSPWVVSNPSILRSIERYEEERTRLFFEGREISGCNFIGPCHETPRVRSSSPFSIRDLFELAPALIRDNCI